MDRTLQELNLIDWSAGFRMAYCQETPLIELIEPFKDAIVRMANRYCKNATACRLEKPVVFNKHLVVLLDGFPKRDNRIAIFRFYVVLPHEAKVIGRKIEKPLLSTKILTEILRSQSAEITNRLGWHIISRERYPRFDPVTTFMNRALIPIGIVAGLLMLFLAYWSSTIISGQSIYSGDGWMVTGSSGGKNAALRRTMEIIEEQKYRFDHMEKHRVSGENVYVYHAVPRPGVRINPQESQIQIRASELPKNPEIARQSSSSTPAESDYGSEAQDKVPEIVIMHARDSSRDTMDSGPNSRRTSITGHRRTSGMRRMSAFDAFKAKNRGFFGGGGGTRPERQKRWKTGSIMLNQFGSKEGKL
uniref:Zonular occludens toxin n=1 Tax=Bursaphelenchus xylophilus TaxID=6326 RepID=A0A1I7SMC3_BURXY